MYKIIVRLHLGSYGESIVAIAFVFGAVGLILLGAAAYVYQGAAAFVAGAERAKGTVVELRRVQSSDGSTYAPVVTYTTSRGNSITFTTLSSSNPPSFSVGERVGVLYAPTNPSDARIDTFWQVWGWAAFLALMGVPFFSIGAGIFLYRRLRARTVAFLKANGRKVMADYQGIEVNTRLEVNRRNPFRVLAQWQDPATSKVHVFHSDNIWFNPEKYIDRKQLVVYLDNASPKRYYVDVSFLPELAE